MFRSIILCGLAAVLFCGSQASDPTGYRSPTEFGEARFAIDAVDFRTEAKDVNRLEIYYKIFNDVFGYEKVGDGYQAEYVISIVVEGDKDARIESLTKEGVVKLVTYEETRRSEDFIINLLSVLYKPQEVKIQASLSDRQGNILAKAEAKLKKKEYWKKYPCLSRVQYAQELSYQQKDSKFNKGEFWVVPSINRLFGEDNDSLLSFYFEVYPGNTQDKQTKVVSRLYQEQGKTVFQDTLELGEFDSPQPVIKKIPVADYLPGDYELEIKVIGRRGREYDKMVDNLEMELTAESMFASDYETAVEMLKYIATSTEMKKLKGANLPEERRRAWDEFWALRTTQGNSQTNPSPKEYFRRVRHANRYFGILKQEGWKTTRGMVYITYGPPDELEDYPFELSSKPYQIWLYYRLNPARRFLFIDEWGDGNYKLQPPYDGL